MRNLFFFILLAAAWIGITVAGEDTPVPPAQVVRELIVAARANDLGGFAHRLDCGKVAMGPHGRSAEDTIAFLRSIELETAEIQGTSTSLTPAPKHEQVILRTPDDEFRFDLELHASEVMLGEVPYSHREIPAAPHYMVTEIHQHR